MGELDFTEPVVVFNNLVLVWLFWVFMMPSGLSLAGLKVGDEECCCSFFSIDSALRRFLLLWAL